MAAPVPIKAGIIYKKSDIVRQWNERWGAAYPGEFLYWKSKEDCVKGKPPRGRIALSGKTAVVSQGYDAMVSRYMFELRGQSITAHFAGAVFVVGQGRSFRGLRTPFPVRCLCSRE